MKILLLPGLHNSGPQHWQSLWETKHADMQRVQQADWDQPQLNVWMAGLSAAVNACQDDVILVAHSLGCALTAWWFASGQPGNLKQDKVKAAFLVAAPDVGRAGFPAPSFSPPVPATVIASENDPWCDFSVAKRWAECWNATFHSVGACGHINGDSGLGEWESGQIWLAELLSRVRHC